MAKLLESTISLCLLPLLASTLVVSSCVTSCDDYATAALTVGVIDSSGTPICDADVVATDGSEEFILEASGCSYAGAWERSGTYVVHVSHDGRTATSESIHVTSGKCHVKGKSVDLAIPSWPTHGRDRWPNSWMILGRPPR